MPGMYRRGGGATKCFAINNGTQHAYYYCWSALWRIWRCLHAQLNQSTMGQRVIYRPFVRQLMTTLLQQDASMNPLLESISKGIYRNETYRKAYQTKYLSERHLHTRIWNELFKEELLKVEPCKKAHMDERGTSIEERSLWKRTLWERKNLHQAHLITLEHLDSNSTLATWYISFCITKYTVPYSQYSNPTLTTLHISFSTTT